MLCDLDNPGVAIGLVAGPGLYLGGCVGVNVGRIWKVDELEHMSCLGSK